MGATDLFLKKDKDTYKMFLGPPVEIKSLLCRVYESIVEKRFRKHHLQIFMYQRSRGERRAIMFFKRLSEQKNVT